ncbi:twin-arginine translocation signal domain-containing protein [Streptomyces sp. ADMS]|uniref:twin-arginine translocation signal domain-containing protein n=1 Tax=Streptomyces sp. ADMS TaxID=3071415 RepID=UPI0029700A2D|nr:twin-arginine translocation signal domain-containing protein [Streptomyces sp. ADMS]MDW4905723.1 twin-arginine translocation signal domain-containing protein [Streptomyces sp. ADMS]
MATEGTSSTRDDDTPSGPLSRRRFLQATATTTALATVGTPVVAAAPDRTSITFTAATGGSATLTPYGDRLVARIQNVLRTVPRGGVPFEQAYLVDAFASPSARRHDLLEQAPPGDWLEVSRHMRREGCCGPEIGG